MRRGPHPLLTALLAALSLAVTASGNSGPAPQLAEALVKSASGPLGEKLGVTDITLLSGETTEETSRLTGELILALIDHFPHVHITPPERVAGLLARQGAGHAALATSGSVRAADLGNEIDSILVGVLSAVDGRSRLTARVFDVGSGRIIASAAVELGGGAERTTEQPARSEVPASQNKFLRVEVRSVGLSANNRALTLALVFRNMLPGEPVYVATSCCYGDWLKVVDDRGQIWKADRGNLTELPNVNALQFAAIEPGGELAVTALLSPWATDNRYPQQIRDPARPGSLSISGSLSRRTQAEQDQGNGRTFPPRGQPFSFGITGVPVP